MKAFSLALLGAASLACLPPAQCLAADVQLSASYEVWSAQQPGDSGDAAYLSAVAYLEKGIPRVQIGWADLEGQEIWVRPVELTASGRFRPLGPGTLVWSGSGLAGYQETQVEVTALPRPRWIEITVIQSRIELGAPKQLRLVVDVGPNREAAVPALMTAVPES